MPSRLALGTVQFGLPYGIANRTGQVSPLEVARILRVVRAAGIDTLDTAAAYGESEERLGAAGISDLRVISKIGEPPDDKAQIRSWVFASVRAALQRLRTHRLAGLLLHRSTSLIGLNGQVFYDAICAVKQEGLVEKIGVSIYDPEELQAIAGCSLDLVQAPFNVLDQRIATSGWLTRLKASGVEVHTRSAFLQGLLLLREEDLPPHFDRWRPLWRRWDDWVNSRGVSRTQACISFVMGQTEIDRVIVGVESSDQLREVICASNENISELPVGFESNEFDLISPARWRIQ